MKQVSISVPGALIPKIDDACRVERARADAALETPTFRTRGDFVTMTAVLWLSMAAVSDVVPQGEEGGDQ